MAKTGDSKAQRDIEEAIVAKLAAELGIALQPQSIVGVEWRIDVDGYCDESGRVVAVEAYARDGSLLPGHKNKIAKDLLKLGLLRAHLDETRGLKPELYYVCVGESVETYLNGSSWIAAAGRAIEVACRRIPLSDDELRHLRSAQDEQKR